MCGGWGSGMGVWMVLWMVLWGLIWVAVLVLLVLSIVWLARGTRSTELPAYDAEETLRRRYAAGEIDAEEYRRRRETLRHD